ncbi:MAG: hypothetical protein KME31_02605 [Tolypothrix carrinoi HA7290-LM1]|nr:hypothetical protein [Tolypothrix carrinoi HA7290-LM1]
MVGQWALSQWAMGFLKRGKGEPLRWGASAVGGFPDLRHSRVRLCRLEACGVKGEREKGKELLPMPHAPCPIPHAPCPMPHAPCPMPHYPLTTFSD